MKNQTNNLSVILKIIATIFIIPLIFSSFSSGFNITTDSTAVVSMFKFVEQDNIFLAEAFICMVLQILVLVFLTFYGVLHATKKTKSKLIGVFLSIVQFALATVSLICVGIYCITKSASGAKYAIGVSPIMYFVCGLIFGGLMIASYFVKDKSGNTHKTGGSIPTKETTNNKEGENLN